jgi:hypothetical protein
MNVARQRTASLQAALGRTTWDNTELWLAQVALGGDVTQRALAEITAGTSPASTREYALLSATFDDHFTDPGHAHPGRCWQDRG